MSISEVFCQTIAFQQHPKIFVHLTNATATLLPRYLSLRVSNSPFPYSQLRVQQRHIDRQCYRFCQSPRYPSTSIWRANEINICVSGQKNGIFCFRCHCCYVCSVYCIYNALQAFIVDVLNISTRERGFCVLNLTSSKSRYAVYICGCGTYVQHRIQMHGLYIARCSILAHT